MAARLWRLCMDGAVFPDLVSSRMQLPLTATHDSALDDAESPSQQAVVSSRLAVTLSRVYEHIVDVSETARRLRLDEIVEEGEGISSDLTPLTHQHAVVCEEVLSELVQV